MTKWSYYKGKDKQPLLILLHGTGGDEESLLPIVPYLNPDANILALRGEVSENGALRFFKRLAEDQFDQDDLEMRGKQLSRELSQFMTDNDFSSEEAVLVGFSNGSNMAINLLLQDKSPFKQAILFAPMYPVDTSSLQEEKKETKVFISMGEKDPIVPLSQSQKVIHEFESRKAQVTSFWVRSHEVTLESLQAAHDWLLNIEKN